ALEVEEDERLPLAADHVQGRPDRTVGLVHHGILFDTTALFSAYLWEVYEVAKLRLRRDRVRQIVLTNRRKLCASASSGRGTSAEPWAVPGCSTGTILCLAFRTLPPPKCWNCCERQVATPGPGAWRRRRRTGRSWCSPPRGRRPRMPCARRA